MADTEAKAGDFKISVGDVRVSDDDSRDIIVVVRLKNRGSRALHYIADLRARTFDPATNKLTLTMSDEGRQVIPGAAAKLPKFNYIDPEADAEIELRIPNRIIKLSRNAPPGELAFEKQDLTAVEQVIVEIAWSDVPYYKDTRKRDPEDLSLPAANWQKHKARTTKRIRKSKKSAE